MDSVTVESNLDIFEAGTGDHSMKDGASDSTSTVASAPKERRKKAPIKVSGLVLYSNIGNKVRD